MSGKKSKPIARGARVTPADPFAFGAPLGETAALLARAVPATAAPSPRARAQLLARVRASKAPPPVPPAATTAGWRFESVNAGEGWRPAFPGVRVKILSVDEARDVVQLFLEMAPGARFPDHIHDAGADEGVVLSGDVITGGRLMRPGDYYHATEGTVHRDTVSPSGCTALVSLTTRAWKKWREQAVAR